MGVKSYSRTIPIIKFRHVTQCDIACTEVGVWGKCEENCSCIVTCKYVRTGFTCSTVFTCRLMRDFTVVNSLNGLQKKN